MRAQATVEPGNKSFIENAVAMHKLWNHSTWAEKTDIERPVLGAKHVEVTTLVQRGNPVSAATTVLLTIDRPGTGFTINLTWFHGRTITARIMRGGRVLGWDEHAERHVRTSGDPKAMLVSAFKYYVTLEDRYAGEAVATVEPEGLLTEHDAVLRRVAQLLRWQHESGTPSFARSPDQSTIVSVYGAPGDLVASIRLLGKPVVDIELRDFKGDDRKFANAIVKAAKEFHELLISSAQGNPNCHLFKMCVTMNIKKIHPAADLEYGLPFNAALEFYNRVHGPVVATVEPTSVDAAGAAKLLAASLGFRVFDDHHGRKGKDFIVAPAGTDTQRLTDCPYHVEVGSAFDGTTTVSIYVFAQCMKSDYGNHERGTKDSVLKYAGYAKKIGEIVKAALREPNPLKFKEHVMDRVEALLGEKFGWPLGNGAMDYYDEQTGYRTGGRAHATVEPGMENGLPVNLRSLARQYKLTITKYPHEYGLFDATNTVYLVYEPGADPEDNWLSCFAFTKCVCHQVKPATGIPAARRVLDAINELVVSCTTFEEFWSAVTTNVLRAGGVLKSEAKKYFDHYKHTVHATVEPTSSRNNWTSVIDKLEHDPRLTVRKAVYVGHPFEDYDEQIDLYIVPRRHTDQHVPGVFAQFAWFKDGTDHGSWSVATIDTLNWVCRNRQSTQNFLRPGCAVQSTVKTIVDHVARPQQASATVEPENEFAKELLEFKGFATRLGFQGFQVKQNPEVGPVLCAQHASQPVSMKFYHGEDHVFATAQLDIFGQAQLAVTWDSKPQKDFLAGRVRKAVADLEDARAAARDPMELHKFVKRFAVNVKPSVVQKFLQATATVEPGQGQAFGLKSLSALRRLKTGSRIPDIKSLINEGIENDNDHVQIPGTDVHYVLDAYDKPTSTGILGALDIYAGKRGHWRQYHARVCYYNGHWDLDTDEHGYHCVSRIDEKLAGYPEDLSILVQVMLHHSLVAHEVVGTVEPQASADWKAVKAFVDSDAGIDFYGSRGIADASVTLGQHGTFLECHVFRGNTPWVIEFSTRPGESGFQAHKCKDTGGFGRNWTLIAGRFDLAGTPQDVVSKAAAAVKKILGGAR